MYWPPINFYTHAIIAVIIAYVTVELVKWALT